MQSPITIQSLRKLLLVLTICPSVLLTMHCHCEVTRPLIIDHDGGVDDFISCTLQFRYSPERIKAITMVPADSFAQPAMWVMKQLKNLLLPSDATIPLGISKDEGTNPFPNEWRSHAWKLVNMQLWNVEKSSVESSCQDVPSALDVLTTALSKSSEPVDIVETGPCTNIAELLRNHPKLKDKINRIYIMGGAVYINGNVEEKGHDGSAEWNIYNNPEAFRQVLASGIHITLISLDATQYTPIDAEFMSQLQQGSAMKSFQFVYESLRTIQPLIDIGQYMFWDTLTSAVAIDPSIVKTKKVKVNVMLSGPSTGRTFEDQEHGFEIDLAIWADKKLFEKTVLDVLSNAERIQQPTLSLNIETNHFKLYCMPNDTEAGHKVLDIAEKNFKKLSENFKHTYSTKINLYVFPSVQDHHNAIGEPSAEDWLVNKCITDTHSIFTVSPNNPGTHHSAQSILDLNIVGLTQLFIEDTYTNPKPRWFSLGIGLWFAKWVSTTALKALAQDHTIIPELQQIGAPSEKLDSQMILQACSYSIIEYIHQKWGWDAILALLADYSSFEKILGSSQETFRDQWIEYLDSNYLDKKHS
jgi:purine nucleosidase